MTIQNHEGLQVERFVPGLPVNDRIDVPAELRGHATAIGSFGDIVRRGLSAQTCTRPVGGNVLASLDQLIFEAAALRLKLSAALRDDG